MGTIIQFPVGKPCSAQKLEQQCNKAAAVFSGMVSPLGRRVPFEKQLFVAFDDSGPTVQVPFESVQFVLELLARMHTGELGYTYDVHAAANGLEDEDTVMMTAAV